jgi:hypothetical protein
VGPTIAAPIAPIACGKNDKSLSRVNTPGETILSAIKFLLVNFFCYAKS